MVAVVVARRGGQGLARQGSKVDDIAARQLRPVNDWPVRVEVEGGAGGEGSDDQGRGRERQGQAGLGTSTRQCCRLV